MRAVTQRNVGIPNVSWLFRRFAELLLLRFAKFFAKRGKTLNLDISALETLNEIAYIEIILSLVIQPILESSSSTIEKNVSSSTNHINILYRRLFHLFPRKRKRCLTAEIRVK